jgi:hypothetical protein
MHKEARTGSQDCGRFVDGFFSFLFAYKGLGKTVLYNDTRDVNKRATYCIIHQFFPIKTCLIPISTPLFSLWYSTHVSDPPIRLALNAASLDRTVLPRWDWLIE